MLRYDSELIPKPLLAFCNKAQLSDNIRVATSLLRCKGTRSAFIALDESYWRPTWEQVVGLVHTDEQQVAVLGGGYHPDPDKNFSLVLGNNLRGLPSAKLARMSVHAVMARTDDRRHTWDVCMVPLLPAAEQGDFSKAEFFVEILGHCMQAYVDTNNLPCMGYALDAGTSNNVARRLALGLQSLEPFEDLPFWKHCCHKNAGLGRYMPISVLHHKPSSTVILASVDNLHLLKRLGAHHVSGTRSIQYGAAVCDLSLALGAGLPPKAYTMHDAMSDKEEAQRTNPACLRSAWCSFGHHGYTLVSSLVALAGEAGDLLTSKERLGAAATCYFFLLMNHMVVKQQHAENAEKYSLPRTTLRNTLHGLLLSILGCMHPGEVGRDSFSARCFQEAVAEHHFGRAKSPYRGTPSFGQGLWGVHRCHVEQLRAKWTAPETGCSPVPSTEVTKVLDDSMEDAAWTLAFMSLGRTASVILADFRAWWPGYGKALVTQGLEEIDDDDDGVDAEGMIFEEEAGEQPADDEDLRLVESLEDHVLNKQQIAQLLDTPPVPEEAAAAASAVVMPSQQAETTEQTEEAETASKHLKAALVLATDASGATSTRPRTWHDLLQRMRTLKDFDLSKPGSELLGACLQRQLLMTPRIRALAASTHHARGILSTAMLSGKEAVCDSDYHKLVHELALARSAGFSDGKRMSRANGWKTVQEKCQAVAMNAAASPWFVHTVTHVRPLTDVEKPQIVLYSYRQGPEVHLGVVTTVFRGAVMKSSSSSRRLRTTKPSTQPLTVSSCAVARVWRCGPTGTTGRQFAVHAASVIDLLDPIGTVIGQIVPATICFTGPEECAIMVLRFNQDQMESIQKVVDSEEAYQEAAAAAPHSVPEPEADTVLNHRSFAHTMQGTTNLVTFMEKLPGLWSARGFQILNDKGGFDLGDGQVVLWTELVQQTPDFFECTCSHVKKDDYGKLIVRKLCDAHPDQGSTCECSYSYSFALLSALFCDVVGLHRSQLAVAKRHSPGNLALDWIVGRPVSVMQFDGWETIMKCADRTDWGLNGLGGLWAFEPSLDSPEEELLEPLPDPLPQLQPLTSMMLIETWKCKARDEDRPNVDDMKVVSLGSSGLVKASLLAMGIESPELPFDWLQISDSGVLHFIRHGWEAPTREGLGAGGQRPSEMHGFFDYMTRRSVPGTPLVMCRSFVHSFWHDDPAKPEVRENFNRLFTQFDELAQEERSLKLFVRAVATSCELGRARDLMEAVTAKFGKQAALLLICDFQSKVQGPHMVDTYDDLLIYFLEGSAHKEAIPYKKPILAALDWIAGMELQVDVASDFKALEALAEPTLWGLRGLGGFNAFEMLPPDNDGDWQPGPEEKWLVDAKIEADNDNKAAERRACLARVEAKTSTGDLSVAIKAHDLRRCSSMSAPG
ncbi:unnamed protein product [Symbiodinium sp. CCMP2592]|nr:unnamed protein product [Symbiodinium sp. CCMP2592]